MRKRLAYGLAAVLCLASGPSGVAARSAPTPPACVRGLGSKPCLGPAQVRDAYHVSSLLHRGITGKGKTIGIVVSFGSATLRSDLHAFDQAFGIPDPHLEIRSPLGTKRPDSIGWQAETTLDVEWAHVMAPGARILVLTSPVDETEGVQGLPQFLALEQSLVRGHQVDVLSQSWGATEDTLLDAPGRAVVAMFHELYAEATRQGVTIVGGSGDDGAAGLDHSVRRLFPFRVVQWPAADPLVLGVGGTQLTPTSAGWQETTWSHSGGGVSKVWAEPNYQRLLPPSVQRLLHGQRGVPDVALSAARQSAVPIYFRGGWGLAGGTSAGTPQWAGLIALADSAAGRDLGDVHLALYRIAASNRYAADLRDIVTGTIVDPPGLPAGTSPFGAAPGWDPATGLGAPRAASLIPDLIRLSKSPRLSR